MFHQAEIMAKTTQEQLDEVQAAISKIVSGAQSYTYENNTVTRADLAKLEAREKTLLTRLAREQRGGGFIARGGVRG